MSYWDGGEETTSFKKNVSNDKNYIYKAPRYEEYLDKKVNIKPLGLEGRIKEVSITRYGVRYLIRYFYNMEIYESYVYADEIEIIGGKI